MKRDIELIDILYKLEEKWSYIKSLDLGDKVKKKNTKLLNDGYQDLYNFYNDNISQDNIIKFLKTEEKYDKIIRKWLVDLLSLKGFCGTYCELMTYYWLKKNKCNFKPQVWLDKDRVINKNGCCIDGRIDNTWQQISFDIKSFGIQFRMIEELKRKIQPYFENKFIQIDGIVDFDFNRYQNHLKNLYPKNNKKDDKSIISKLKKDNYIKLDDIGISIGIQNFERFSVSVKEIDGYRFAMENSHYVIKNLSQFTVKEPFILICSFSKYNNRFLHDYNDEFIKVTTRALARRAFVEYFKSEQLASNFDKNIKDNIKVRDAIKYLSGIIFLNVNKEKSWVYLNPNSQFKLEEHSLNNALNYTKLEILDDFKYDNY
ncbi:hypothetical protein [Vallitalea guaymasensis]|uniref:hypothetical protein n=1 Tax=Vallitalea guaymasensis TaxID=1185412 RepID=UPI0023566DA5|nr:hypothetical protein [Vallitalea guaymasensis]